MDLYDILSINAQDSEDPEKLKKAYRTALLRSHPDKVGQNDQSITVEMVMKAYDTLSDVEKKNAYDKTVNGRDNDSVNTPFSVSEVVDLDDLVIHEENEENLRWTKSCRCGAEEGYIVTEKDLLANGNAEEIYIQCLGCSIWIKVLYSTEE